MSEVKETPVQDAVAEFYLRNCRLRHGHPPLDEDLYVQKSPPSAVPKPVVSPSVPAKVVDTVAGAGVAAGGGLLRKALPYALAGVLGLSTAGLGLGYLLPGNTDKDQENSGQDVQNSARDGSILQYLEDHNWHLP